jgi:hypothetical protein
LWSGSTVAWTGSTPRLTVFTVVGYDQGLMTDETICWPRRPCQNRLEHAAAHDSSKCLHTNNAAAQGVLTHWSLATRTALRQLVTATHLLRAPDFSEASSASKNDKRQRQLLPDLDLCFNCYGNRWKLELYCALGSPTFGDEIGGRRGVVL